MNGGTGGRAKTDDRVPLAGKTGTTDAMVHTWMTGYSSKVSTATWVGNVSGKQNVTRISVDGTPGGVIRHEIWRTIMTLANELYPGEAFAAPPASYLGASSITMPDINALPPDVAQQILRDAGLSAVVSDVTVVSQNPIGTTAYASYPAGASVPFGTLVTISISRGGTVVVPDVSGLSVTDAKAALLAAGFSVVSEPQPSQSQFFVKSATIPEGNVVGTNPTAGSSAEVLGAILLIISKGP
jgi:beta-lactam-binding protein with PASTA domain